MTNNEVALLKTIGFSEIGRELLAHSDNGYNVLFGGCLFQSYQDHPRKAVTVNGLTSTAAGKYQILERTYDYYKKFLKLPDFSPASQDAIALELIKERGADMLINEGQFNEAIVRCNNIWASLPNSPYNQHTNSVVYLEAYYSNVGGTLA
jgi:muramidase (phage lysozyme)